MSVCDNQDQFNKAIKKAVKYTEDRQRNKQEPGMIIYTIIWSMFLIWAVILAMQVSSDQKVLHIILAILVAPIYVISHYVSSYTM